MASRTDSEVGKASGVTGVAVLKAVLTKRGERVLEPPRGFQRDKKLEF
jgi:hypothetical protein